MIQKIGIYFTVIIIYSGLFFGGGYWYGRKSKIIKTKPIIKTVTEIKWKDRVVYQPDSFYANISQQDCSKQLKIWHTAKPRLSLNYVDGFTYRMDAGLYERDWDKSVEIECHSSKDWKFTLGISGVVAGIAGGITYYIVKKKK